MQASIGSVKVFIWDSQLVKHLVIIFTLAKLTFADSYKYHSWSSKKSLHWQLLPEQTPLSRIPTGTLCQGFDFVRMRKQCRAGTFLPDPTWLLD